VRGWAARWCALQRRKQAREAACSAALQAAARAGAPDADTAALQACLAALDKVGSQEVRAHGARGVPCWRVACGPARGRLRGRARAAVRSQVRGFS
jgi:hypothetical protein